MYQVTIIDTAIFVVRECGCWWLSDHNESQMCQ